MANNQIINNLEFSVRAIDIFYSREKMYDSNKDFASKKDLGETFKSCYLNIFADYKGKNATYENTHQITIGGKRQGFIKVEDVSDKLFDEIPESDFTFIPTKNANKVYLHLISYKNADNLAECYICSTDALGYKSEELKLCTLNKHNKLTFNEDVFNYFFERQKVGLDHEKTKLMGSRADIDDVELLDKYGFEAKNSYAEILNHNFDSDEAFIFSEVEDYNSPNYEYSGKDVDDFINEIEDARQEMLEDNLEI